MRPARGPHYDIGAAGSQTSISVPLPSRAAAGNSTAMGIDDPFDDGKAEPRADLVLIAPQ